jgi:hypothetical protein
MKRGSELKNNQGRYCGKTSPNPSKGGESPSLLGRAGMGCNSGLLRYARNDGMAYRLLILIVFFLFTNTLNLFGQTDLRFVRYNNSDEFKNPMFSQIFLIFPKGDTNQLYSDTTKSSEFLYADYFHDKGEYSLKVIVESEEFGKDSIIYPFELNGEETDIGIDIRFQYDRKKIKKHKEKKILKSYVFVKKYYKPSKDISIHLTDFELSEEVDVLGPYFTLINNSKDTLYGEWLSGYFWGRISFMIDDSTWSRKTYGNIDVMCIRRPPLYPDSIIMATVGTWGYRSNLPKNKYRYELLFRAGKRSVKGYSKYKKGDNFMWHVSTTEYCRLIYEFEKE